MSGSLLLQALPVERRSLSESDLGALIKSMFLLHGASYVIAAMAALLVYDILISFSDEVTLVWPSKWTFTKALYYYNRYSPLVDTMITAHLIMWEHPFEECLPQYKVIAWLTVIGLCASEGIVMIRTYALWARNHWIKRIFITLLFATTVSSAIITQMFLESLLYGPPPAPNMPGCFARQQRTFLWISFLLFIIMETIVVILTFVRGYDHLRHVRTPLVCTLYKDGFLYYVYFLAITTANVVIFFVAPPELINVLTTPLRVLHSLLSTRIVLHIRASVLERHKRQQHNTLLCLHPQTCSHCFAAYERDRDREWVLARKSRDIAGREDVEGAKSDGGAMEEEEEEEREERPVPALSGPFSIVDVSLGIDHGRSRVVMDNEATGQADKPLQTRLLRPNGRVRASREYRDSRCGCQCQFEEDLNHHDHDHGAKSNPELESKPESAHAGVGERGSSGYRISGPSTGDQLVGYVSHSHCSAERIFENVKAFGVHRVPWRTSWSFGLGLATRTQVAAAVNANAGASSGSSRAQHDCSRGQRSSLGHQRTRSNRSSKPHLFDIPLAEELRDIEPRKDCALSSASGSVQPSTTQPHHSSCTNLSSSGSGVLLGRRRDSEPKKKSPKALGKMPMRGSLSLSLSGIEAEPEPALNQGAAESMSTSARIQENSRRKTSEAMGSPSPSPSRTSRRHRDELEAPLEAQTPSHHSFESDLNSANLPSPAALLPVHRHPASNSRNTATVTGSSESSDRERNTADRQDYSYAGDLDEMPTLLQSPPSDSHLEDNEDVGGNTRPHPTPQNPLIDLSLPLQNDLMISDRHNSHTHDVALDRNQYSPLAFG